MYRLGRHRLYYDTDKNGYVGIFKLDEKGVWTTKRKQKKADEGFPIVE